MGPGVLSEILSAIPRETSPSLLVGFDTSDDACVYQINEETAIIQTVDFFPPVVDDPYTYGQIAAANALSDVYAMGGKVLFALNLLCYPSTLTKHTVREILRGGYEKVAEAGAVVAGGHTIDDPIPKYGLSVCGQVHPKGIWANAGAKEGDLLVLTKPLGSGITATAAKSGDIGAEEFAESIRVMAKLNQKASLIAREYRVHACTDITGFGLLGHGLEMAEGSGVTMELWSGAPKLLPGALRLAREGIVPGGSGRNMAYVRKKVLIPDGLPQERRDILSDPQTSGGLLLSMPEADARQVLSRLEALDGDAAIVGCVKKLGAHAIVVKE